LRPKAAITVRKGRDQPDGFGPGLRSREPEMKGLDILLRDHRRLRTDLSRLRKARVSRRGSLFDRFRHDVELHGRIESKLFYPLLRSTPVADISRRVDQGLHDHLALEVLFARISEKRFDDAGFADRVDELAQLLEHHFRVEETEFFPVAAGKIPADRLRELDADIVDMKNLLAQPAPS
jgi:hypothetical protein